MSKVDELNETNAAVNAAIDRLGDVVRNEASELRERFDAIGNAYAAGLGPEAVSEEIEKGKARLEKLSTLAEAIDELSETSSKEDETEHSEPPAPAEPEDETNAPTE